MSPCTSPSICTSPLETRLPLMVRSGPMTEGALRSAAERAMPRPREEVPGTGGALNGERLGLTFDGSESDLLKFGNIGVHLCSDATIATGRLLLRNGDQAAAAERPPLQSSKHSL